MKLHTNLFFKPKKYESYIYFPAPLVDYSVRVSHMDLNEIKEALGLYNQGQNKEKLRKSLAKKLKDKHPIHKKVKTFTSAQLNMVLSNLSLTVKNRENQRKMKAISDYFFREYPDAPLSNLERIMDEDSYFSQLTNPGKYQPSMYFLVFILIFLVSCLYINVFRSFVFN